MNERLDARPLELPFDGREPKTALERQFWTFHDANPAVYAKLRELALQAKEAGAPHIGIALLFERLRWFALVETVGDEFRLNNNYRAFYSRLLMDREPALRGFFRLRPSDADDMDGAAA